MVRKAAPPPPAKIATKRGRLGLDFDPMARALALTVREGHGIDASANFDMSGELGAIRGYIGTRNIALQRALGAPGFPLGRISEVSGWQNAGKAEVLTALLLTPQGFIPMGAVSVGDMLIGRDGKPHRVQGVFPQGVLPVFDVVMSDGAVVRCSDDHLWFTETRNERRSGDHTGSAKPLHEIRRTLFRPGNGDLADHALPAVAPVEFQPCGDLPLGPYLLGLLIGDGGFTQPQVVFTKPEGDVIANLVRALPLGDRVTDVGDGKSVRIGSAERGKSRTRSALIDLGLDGKYSHQKFIPTPYLFASIADRIQLLRGLCDTDGTVPSRGEARIEYSTSSEQLAKDVAFLARSLGASVRVSIKPEPHYSYKGEQRTGLPSWRLYIAMRSDIVPVSSRKHLAKWSNEGNEFRQSIAEIIPAGEAECQCIMIEGGLYVTNDFVVTHNSTMLDQAIACCQNEEDGVAALADVERARDRAYMEALGVTGGLVQIKGATIEEMFSEIETLIRKRAHESCMAWVEALQRQKVKIPMPHPAVYEVPNPDDPSKAIAKYSFVRWGRDQAAALMEWQTAQGLPAFGLRDIASNEALRPYVLYREFARDHLDIEEAQEAWADGDETHPLTKRAHRPLLIGWDSIASSPSSDEMDHNSYESRQQPASAARVIKYNFRRLVQLFDDEAVAFVLVNQRYQVIMQGRQGYGGPTSETYGGGGIKFHTTIRIELDKVGDIWNRADDKENKIPPMGQIVQIKVPKNKVNSPFSTENYGLIFGRGADNAWAVHEDFKTRGIIASSSGWSRFKDPSILGSIGMPGDKSFAGWKGLSNLIAENPALWGSLKAIFLEGRR